MKPVTNQHQCKKPCRQEVFRQHPFGCQTNTRISSSVARRKTKNNSKLIGSRATATSRCCWRYGCSLLLNVTFFAAIVIFRAGEALASSNPLELNGGSCLAMAGKGCVALAVDRRLGLEGQLISADAKRVLKVRRTSCRPRDHQL